MFCRHFWRAISTHFAEPEGGTDVLYRCEKCGANKTEYLRGDWSNIELELLERKPS